MERAKIIFGHSIIVIFTVCFLGVGAVLAQDIELIGSYEYCALRCVFIDGDYAFIGAACEGEILIMDISDPGNPVLISEYITRHVSRGLFVQGDYLYSASGYDGFEIFDVSDPASPIPVGNWNAYGRFEDVFVEGDYAYLSLNAGGFQIMDISDPENPTPLGNYDPPQAMVGIHVIGTYAYSASGWEGMEIVDISDLANPVPIGSCQLYDFPMNIFVKDSYAYVADRYEGLTIVDISNPVAPSIAGNIDTDGRALDVYVSRDLAYVADRDEGFSIFDISDPSNPSLLSSLYTGGRALSIFQKGYYTFLIARDYDDYNSLFGIFWYTQMDSGAVSGTVTNPIGEPLEEVSVSVLDAPMRDQTAPSGDYSLQGFYTGDYDIRFTHPYYADTVVTGVTIESGLMTYLDVMIEYPPLADAGVSTIISPIDSVLEGAPYPPISEITNFGYDPQTFDVVFEIYVSDTDDLIFADTATAYDVPEMAIDTIAFQNSFTPGHATSYDLISYTILPGDENAHNDTATAICHSYRVYPEVEDVSVFTAPSLILDLYVSNSLAILCTDDDLMIVDVSDPENPSLVSIFGGHFLHVSVVGDYAYLYSGLPGNLLSVVDISNPAYPTLVGSCDFGGSSPIWDLFVQGNYAYLTDHSYNGIHVVDVADPTNPSYLTTYDAPEGIFSVFVLEDYAYLSASHYGLQILDISIPENPVFVGSYDTPGRSFKTFVENDYAYVADSSSLQILDISNPSNPVFTSQFDAYHIIGLVKVHFEYAYIIDGIYGLEILDISSPETPVYAGGYDPEEGGMEFCVRGDYIYLADVNLLRILRFAAGGSDCQYIPGDVDHNGIPLELSDLIAIIAGYRGMAEPNYTCDCPPYGDDFAPEHDPDGNCVTFELSDVVRMIAAYRGTATLSSCIDCPGSR